MTDGQLVEWRLNKVEQAVDQHEKELRAIDKTITRALTACVLLTALGQLVLPVLLKKLGWM